MLQFTSKPGSECNIFNAKKKFNELLKINIEELKINDKKKDNDFTPLPLAYLFIKLRVSYHVLQCRRMSIVSKTGGPAV